MKVKKSKKADLENKRSLFFQLGLVISIAATVIAFEWNSSGSYNSFVPLSEMSIEDYELPQVIPDKKNQERKKPTPIALDPESIIPDYEDPSLEWIPVDVDPGIFFDFTAFLEPEPEPNVVDNLPVWNPDVYPQFHHPKYSSFQEYVFANIIYPEKAREIGISGRVFVVFVISKTGKVEQVEIHGGADPLLAEEAMRVIKASPDWIPGRQGTRNVSVHYVFPVVFRLN